MQDSQTFSWYCKNKHSVIVKANLATVRALGCQNVDQLIGKVPSEYPCQASELADKIIAMDRCVLDSQTLVTSIIQGYFFSESLTTWLSQRSVLLDDSDRVIGIEGAGIDITNHYRLRNHILLLNERFLDKNCPQFIITIEKDYPDINLSPRQTECLFYLMRGHTLSQVANIMKVTARTVENMLAKIKLRTGTCSKSELIDKCVSNGLVNILPSSIYEKVIKPDSP